MVTATTVVPRLPRSARTIRNVRAITRRQLRSDDAPIMAERTLPRASRRTYAHFRENYDEALPSDEARNGDENRETIRALVFATDIGSRFRDVSSKSVRDLSSARENSRSPARFSVENAHSVSRTRDERRSDASMSARRTCTRIANRTRVKISTTLTKRPEETEETSASRGNGGGR